MRRALPLLCLGACFVQPLVRCERGVRPRARGLVSRPAGPAPLAALGVGLALPWLLPGLRRRAQEAQVRRLQRARPGKEQELERIAGDPWKLEASALASDLEVVRLAVARDGLALQFAPSFQAERSVVETAVRADGYALKYAAPELQGDLKVVKLACAQNGYALQYASEELRDRRDVVLLALSQVAYAFQYASEALRSDESMVRRAVRRRGTCLEFASEALRGNREVVKLAAGNNGNALSYAPEELQQDPELLRVAKRAEDRNGLIWAAVMSLGALSTRLERLKQSFSS